MHFRKIGIKSGIHFGKIGIKLGIHFGKIGIRNGYVFETSMARPHPKSGQVAPPRGGHEAKFIARRYAQCFLYFMCPMFLSIS